MATSKISEPYVKVTEKIRDYPVLLNIEGDSNIGGVIVAPTGPRMTLVTGPEDFLSKFTVDGNVPRNADITFLNAYYLSYSTGLVIARSMNTTAVGGIFFTKSAVTSTTKLNIVVSDSDLWGIKLGDYYYYHYKTTTSWESYAAAVTANGDTLSSTVTGLDVADRIHCDSIVDLADKICKTEGGYNSSTGTWTSADWKDAVTYNSTSYYLLYTKVTAPTSATITDAYNCSASVESPVTNSYTLDSNKLNFKEGIALTKSATLTITALADANLSESNYAFTLGLIAYIHGAVDRTIFEDYSIVDVTSIDDIVTSINGMPGISAENIAVTGTTSAEIKISCSDGNELLSGSSVIGCTVTGLNATSGYTTSTNYDKRLFSIEPSLAQSTDAYTVLIDQKANAKSFKMTLSDGITTNSYTVSLDQTAVDSDGNNIFLENLNAVDTGYQFEVNTSEESVDSLVYRTYSFGNSGFDLSASGNVTSMIDAAYALDDQAIYDIDYLSCFGYTNLSFIKNLSLIGSKHYWYLPIDIPYTKTNKNSIMEYCNSIDDSSLIEVMGPFDKNIGLTGWSFPLACSSLYYAKLYQNRAASKEFAGIFEITNGVLSVTNPYYQLSKSDRTALLNASLPINFMVYNQRSSVYYLNDNRTHQSTDNIVSEDGNRRLVNKINRDVKLLMNRFKGLENTDSTRSDVVTTINSYINSEIMTQQYKLNEFKVICNTDNNTTDQMNQHMLGVTIQERLQGSIKFIDILNDVYPLGVDFTN